MIDYKTITNIEIAYLFAKNMNHGVHHTMNKNQDWALFEPSKFIYAFFSFNMLYNIDWNKTIENMRIRQHSSIKTGQQIKYFTEFIHNHSKNVYEELNNLDFNQIIRNSKYLERDININKKNIYVKPKRTYLENYEIAMKELTNKRLSCDSHYRILSFCNQIRNNIFHGLKTISHMEMKDQRIRLVDYTNILLESMEVFFNILNKEIDYNRAEQYALDENILRI